MRRPARVLSFLALIGLLAACTSSGSGSSGSGAPATESAGASESASAAASASTSASAGAGGECTPEGLETVNAGRLTVATSNPAFPPYVLPPNDGEEATDPWELGDPTKGRGFEAAVAYAVAEELGYAAEDVDWVAVPFENTFAPGEKDFDFALQQISYTEERAEVVDMSDGYYFVNQALVTREGTTLDGATSMDEVRAARLGVAASTTSLTYIEEVIQPEQDPMVYNDNTGAISALDAEQVDGIVVDLPTAFYITAVEMEDGVIVGQFPAAGNEEEYFSLVLELDSPLTGCVNQALAALTESGDLEALTEEWMSDAAGAPVIEP